jgi:hypothetical protein
MTGKRQSRPKPGTKRGRPPLPADQRKRAPLGFRPTPKTRQNLEQAAEESGRSLSAEIEFQIQRSFAEEETTESLLEEVAKTVRESFGGVRLYEDAQWLSVALRIVERKRNEEWNASAGAIAETEGAVQKMLHLISRDPAQQLSTADIQAARKMGRELADFAVEEIDKIVEKQHPWLKKAREIMAKDKAKPAKPSSKGG